MVRLELRRQAKARTHSNLEPRAESRPARRMELRSPAPLAHAWLENDPNWMSGSHEFASSAWPTHESAHVLADSDRPWHSGKRKFSVQKGEWLLFDFGPAGAELSAISLSQPDSTSLRSDGLLLSKWPGAEIKQFSLGFGLHKEALNGITFIKRDGGGTKYTTTPVAQRKKEAQKFEFARREFGRFLIVHIKSNWGYSHVTLKTIYFHGRLSPLLEDLRRFRTSFAAGQLGLRVSQRAQALLETADGTRCVTTAFQSPELQKLMRTVTRLPDVIFDGKLSAFLRAPDRSNLVPKSDERGLWHAPFTFDDGVRMDEVRLCCLCGYAKPASLPAEDRYQGGFPNFARDHMGVNLPVEQPSDLQPIFVCRRCQRLHGTVPAWAAVRLLNIDVEAVLRV